MRFVPEKCSSLQQQSKLASKETVTVNSRSSLL